MTAFDVAYQPSIDSVLVTAVIGKLFDVTLVGEMIAASARARTHSGSRPVAAANDVALPPIPEPPPPRKPLG